MTLKAHEGSSVNFIFNKCLKDTSDLLANTGNAGQQKQNPAQSLKGHCVTPSAMLLSIFL